MWIKKLVLVECHVKWTSTDRDTSHCFNVTSEKEVHSIESLVKTVSCWCITVEREKVTREYINKFLRGNWT